MFHRCHKVFKPRSFNFFGFLLYFWPAINMLADLHMTSKAYEAALKVRDHSSGKIASVAYFGGGSCD